MEKAVEVLLGKEHIVYILSVNVILCVILLPPLPSEIGLRLDSRLLNSNRNPQTSVYSSSAITAKINFQSVSECGIRSQTVFLKSFFTKMSQNY